MSDHNIIFFSRKLSKKRLNRPHRPQPFASFIPKSLQQNFVAALKRLEWDEIFLCNDIDSGCSVFLSKLSKVMEAFTRKGGHGKGQRVTLPWIDDHCRNLMKKRDQLLKKSLKSGLTTDRQQFSHARNLVTQILRKAKARFYINIIESHRGNGKKVWDCINKLTGRLNNKTNKTLELKINNVLVKDPLTLAKTLNAYFISSVTQIVQLFTPSVYSPCPIKDDLPIFRLEEITEAEVGKIIRSLKSSKAKDAYGLDSNFLKSNADHLIKPLTHLVNLSINQCTVPSQWKVAMVTPIFKSGAKTDMANYRPISILPIISKVAEKWMVSLITKHLDKGHTPLHHMQFGFRALHSTETATCMLTEKVKHMLDSSPCAMAVFLDLKRAFDTVDHQVLLSKLSHFNFSTEAIQWFRSYLSNRKQCVVVNNVKSFYLSCSVGVPQGSILGPLLFSLYINDLPDVCNNVHFQMYADDAVILTYGKSYSEVSKTLTSVMSKVQDWLTASCLYLNTQKTVCMAFSKRPVVLQNSNVFLKGEELSLVTEFKYLGVILDPTLSSKKHVKRVIKTVKFNLSNFRQIRSSLTEEAAKTFMHSMIFSHIEYCLPIWSLTGKTILKSIESLYKKTLKTFDKKSLSHHHCEILTRRKLLSFDSLITLKLACCVYRIMNRLAPPPLSQFFERKSTSGTNTRATTRGDCAIAFRRTSFSQSSLSVRGSKIWNGLPASIRDCSTFFIFKRHLKDWLKSNQTCNHC